MSKEKGYQHRRYTLPGYIEANLSGQPLPALAAFSQREPDYFWMMRLQSRNGTLKPATLRYEMNKKPRHPAAVEGGFLMETL